jgi:hypothetical protein
VRNHFNFCNFKLFLFLILTSFYSYSHPLDEALSAYKGITEDFFIVRDFFNLGFIHIIPKGLDHILFVLALFFLSSKLSTLLWQVTAFTLAHTVTLALTIFGVINLSPSIVEPIIALSIAFIAFENIYRRDLKFWRVLVVFLFGLIHGMGFAGVLSGLGLPENSKWLALIAFNVGVEAGQIVVILSALALVWSIRNKSWYRQRVTTPVSIIIGCIGLFWFFERLSDIFI